MLGSLFAYYINKNMVISIIALILVFVMLLVISIVKKKLKYLLIPSITFIFAFAIFNVATYNFNQSVEYSPEVISARVYSISSIKQGVITVKADSCEFDGEKVKTNLNILIYDKTSLFCDIEIGSLITFTPLKVFKADLNYNDIPNAKAFQNNLKYTAITYIEDLQIDGTDLTFAEKIKKEIKENLNGNLNNENAELAY